MIRILGEVFGCGATRRTVVLKAWGGGKAHGAAKGATWVGDDATLVEQTIAVFENDRIQMIVKQRSCHGGRLLPNPEEGIQPGDGVHVCATLIPGHHDVTHGREVNERGMPILGPEENAWARHTAAPLIAQAKARYGDPIGEGEDASWARDGTHIVGSQLKCVLCGGLTLAAWKMNDWGYSIHMERGDGGELGGVVNEVFFWSERTGRPMPQ
jgi:hypothetical protein